MIINFELKEKPGVYIIKNNTNSKKYIGSSKDLYNRLHQHFNNLKYNKHHSGHLQNSYNKYGEDSFIYDVLEFCSVEDLEVKEQYWIDLISPEYNKRIDATRNTGLQCKEETKSKISNTLKNRYSNKEISAYRQDHIRMPCSVYNINKELIKSFDCITNAYKYVYPNYHSKVSFKRIDGYILNEQYVIVVDTILDVNFYIDSIIYKNKNGKYLVSYNENEKHFFKTAKDWSDFHKIYKSTLYKHLKKDVKYKHGNYITEYQDQYKPI